MRPIPKTRTVTHLCNTCCKLLIYLASGSAYIVLAASNSFAFGSIKGVEVGIETSVPGAGIIWECFEKHLKSKDVPISRLTEVFAFDQLAANLDEFSLLRNPDEWNSFCNERVIKPYDHLYENAEAERVERNAGQLGPMGYSLIESESPFLTYSNNLTSKEVYGHANISSDALVFVSSKLPMFHLTEGAREFLLQSSQFPDYYHWHDEEFHAHTPDEKDARFKEFSRAARIQKGQEIFISHITSYYVRSLEELRAFNVAAAILNLGIVLHGLQDLTYHKGMTISQHSGLAYAGGFTNPDYPKGRSKAETEEAARGVTSDMLSLYIADAGVCGGKWLNAWGGLAGHNVEAKRNEFLRFIKSSGRGHQDIGYWALLAYYSLSTDYKTNGPKRLELETPNSEFGLVQWSPPAVFETIRSQIQSLEEVEKIRLDLNDKNQCE